MCLLTLAFWLHLISNIVSISNLSNMNQLMDQISTITEYLPRSDQMIARMVSRRFNSYRNIDNSEIIQNMHNFSIFAAEVIVDGRAKNESFEAVKRIYDRFKHNEFYLKWWPKIIQNCLQQNSDQQNKTWMQNFLRFVGTLGCKPWNQSCLLYGNVRSLVMISHILFDSLFLKKPKYLNFHLFLYEALWDYLSISLLPPLKSIYYLDSNSDLWSKQVANLNELQQKHGLIVWDPSMLQTKWSAASFYENINEFVHFKKYYGYIGYNGFDSEFVQFAQIRFILRLLDGNEYDLKFSDTQHPLWHEMDQIIRESVHHLSTNRKWKQLDQILFALHHNNGISLLGDDCFLTKLCVDANATDSFVGILVNLHQSPSNRMSFVVNNYLAKSMFLWFVKNEMDQAMISIAKLCDDELFDPYFLDCLVISLRESLFHFANSSKQKYLAAVVEEIFSHRQDWSNIFNF